MTDIRGEKVHFSKDDIVALHSLPSAQAQDPLIVDAPRERLKTRFCLKAVASLVCALVILIAAAIGTIESGLLNTTLNARAAQALNAAIGRDYQADVGSTVLRVTSGASLALEARDVALSSRQSGLKLLTTQSISIVLDPLSLLRGRIAVARLEASGATLDPAVLPQGRAIDLTAVKIGAVPQVLETVFEQIDRISHMVAASDTAMVDISDMTLSFLGPRKRVIPVHIDRLGFDRSNDGAMQISGNVTIEGVATTLGIKATTEGGRIARLEGTVDGLPVAPFAYRVESATEPAFGIESTASLRLSAVRASDAAKPSLAITLDASAGAFHAGGFESQLMPSEVNAAYDFDRKAIDILPSTISVGRSSFPLSGTLLDLVDDATDTPQQGFAIDLLLRGATTEPVDVTETPLTFDAKATGRFLSNSHELVFNELQISSGLGAMAGSLSITFGETSPQISFAAVTSSMQSAAVKQLWPWWIGKNARRWVLNNLYGGTVKNGRIQVFIDKGRLARTIGPIELAGDEISIDFDIEDARVNIAGDIPPLRDAYGSFSLKGERLAVAIKKGTAFFPSGRTVTLNSGDFLIADVHKKPLMAEMKIEVAGQADALAKLASYRPIQALQRTPYKPEDFSGPMTAMIGARFGLIAAQNPPKPEWQTEMTLDGVAVGPPVSGRTVTGIDGRLRIDNKQAQLDAKAVIDGAPMTLSLTEPVTTDGSVKRHREIRGTLSEDARDGLAPGLAGLVGGSIDIAIVIDGDDRQSVEADLTDATIDLPWVGWSKGKGIGAKATFEVDSDNGTTRISDFALKGEGFGASGQFNVDKQGLALAKLQSVRLAPGDNFSATVARQGKGFAVAVNGKQVDLRPVLTRIKAGSDGGSGSGGAAMTVKADVDRVIGFDNESMDTVTMTYASRGALMEGLTLSAVMEGGQALVANLVRNNADPVLELTAGNAGALARFAGIYQNMRGGLLNLTLRDRGAGSWRGNVDLRKFALVDEARLQSIVSTPAGSDGRSLNQAVKRDIDVSSATFERGSAQLMLDRGTIRIERGVVRGTDIGATFQGTVRDENGRMDMTGTFMPAYGLNRLFAELPLIGVILGNGRDRGLLGITFKLAGSITKPQLTINPLSIIAPGVFRSIFEF